MFNDVKVISIGDLSSLHCVSSTLLWLIKIPVVVSLFFITCSDLQSSNLQVNRLHLIL